jgi:solute carrier family 8 (sodium/calcium exchanger)
MGATSAGLLDWADTLGEMDRLALLRRLLAHMEPAGPGVEIYERGYVVYASHEGGTQHCTSWLLAPGTNLNAAPGLAIVYLVGLVWVFLGIAIISDIFMAAIEVITAAEGTKRYVTDGGRVVEYKYKLVNPTVANLTLMALGSSAPEILLSVIGTIATLDEEPDRLGPSTIVGSAAFNLLLITAICVSALPDGEHKKIEDLSVFMVTAIFSVVAYVWLYIALEVASPEVVELWEAFVTLGLFGVLLVIAYSIDVRGRCCRVPAHVQPGDEEQQTQGSSSSRLTDRRASAEQLMSELHKTRVQNGAKHMSVDQAEIAASHEDPYAASGYQQLHTGFMRGLTGQRRLQEHVSHDEGLSAGADGGNSAGKGAHGAADGHAPPSKPRSGSGSEAVIKSVEVGARKVSLIPTVSEDDALVAEELVHAVNFGRSRYTVGASWGSAVALVTIDPPLPRRVTIGWRTQAASSSLAEDSDSGDERRPTSNRNSGRAADCFEQAVGKLTLGAGERTALVTIPILESAVPRRSSSSVTLVLTGVEEAHGQAAERVALGTRARTTLVVVGSEFAPQPARGRCQFTETTIVCEEACGSVRLAVVRVGGSDGSLELSYATHDGTAKQTSDYVATSGTLVFGPGETSKEFDIEIVDDEVEEDDETFTVELSAKSANALASDKLVCTIKIIDDDSWRVRASATRS